jgi:hypothetical protein
MVNVEPLTLNIDTSDAIGESTLAGEAASNSALSAMNPVLYGAFLSYAIYCVAEIVAAAETPAAGLSWRDALLRLIIGLTMLVFLVKDFGEVLKIDRECPHRRVTRYLTEVAAVLFYAVSFGLVRTGTYFSVLSFAVAIFLGGLWCNALQVERKRDISNVATLARTLRGLHYFGAGLCILQVVIFSIFAPVRIISVDRALTFAVLMFIWLVTYEYEVNYHCGPYTGIYTVNYVVTPRRLARWKEKKQARVDAAAKKRATYDAERAGRYLRPKNHDNTKGDL